MPAAWGSARPIAWVKPSSSRPSSLPAASVAPKMPTTGARTHGKSHSVPLIAPAIRAVRSIAERDRGHQPRPRYAAHQLGRGQRAAEGRVGGMADVGVVSVVEVVLVAHRAVEQHGRSRPAIAREAHRRALRSAAPARDDAMQRERVGRPEPAMMTASVSRMPVSCTRDLGRRKPVEGQSGGVRGEFLGGLLGGDGSAVLIVHLSGSRGGVPARRGGARPGSARASIAAPAADAARPACRRRARSTASPLCLECGHQLSRRSDLTLVGDEGVVDDRICARDGWPACR